MKWSLRLSEFYLRVLYNKGIPNAQSNALSRLRTLVETTIQKDKYTPCLTMEEDDTEHQWGYSKDDEECNTNLFLHEPNEHSTYVPTIPEQLKLAQETDEFGSSMVSCFNQKEMTPVPEIANGDGQIRVLRKLHSTEVHISYNRNTSGHPKGRRL